MNEGEMINKEIELAKGHDLPHNRLENQIHIAVELIKRRFEGEGGLEINLDSRDNRNEVMEYWVKYGYSDIYKMIEDSQAFKKHPRLKGDIYKLTADDIISYKEKGVLPD